MPKDSVITLPVNEIEATSATQVRVRIDPVAVAEYAEALTNGAIFPPIVCYAEEGSERYILADGFHRLAAYTEAGIDEIEVELRQGGMGEALDFALGANSQHGIRRTSADKRHAVMMALKDPRHKKKTLRDIADLCRVSHETVRYLKQEKNQEKRVSKIDKPPAKEPADGNEQKNVRPAPTQEEIDKRDMLDACNVINSFPYTGYDGVSKMELDSDDYKTMSNAADWLDSALAAMGEQDD
jgi:hypothetical protein